MLVTCTTHPHADFRCAHQLVLLLLGVPISLDYLYFGLEQKNLSRTPVARRCVRRRDAGAPLDSLCLEPRVDRRHRPVRAGHFLSGALALVRPELVFVLTGTPVLIRVWRVVFLGEIPFGATSAALCGLAGRCDLAVAVDPCPTSRLMSRCKSTPMRKRVGEKGAECTYTNSRERRSAVRAVWKKRHGQQMSMSRRFDQTKARRER